MPEGVLSTRRRGKRKLHGSAIFGAGAVHERLHVARVHVEPALLAPAGSPRIVELEQIGGFVVSEHQVAVAAGYAACWNHDPVPVGVEHVVEPVCATNDRILLEDPLLEDIDRRPEVVALDAAQLLQMKGTPRPSE